jgi:hypothetical protein
VDEEKAELIDRKHDFLELLDFDFWTAILGLSPQCHLLLPTTADCLYNNTLTTLSEYLVPSPSTAWLEIGRLSHFLSYHIYRLPPQDLVFPIHGGIGGAFRWV